MRRTLILLVTLAAVSVGAGGPQMNVYKTRTCGCCGKWAEMMRTSGFTVNVQDVPSTAEYQVKYGVPEQLRSCHTAVVGGYTVEGHVPAADIHRLLKSKPKAKGIAVPGMPIGSPGMESGDRVDPYAVMLFDGAGKAAVFQRYPRQQGGVMMTTYTAKYTRLRSGYMGQFVEWPEVVTEGRTLEDCRQMLPDARNEMILAYRQQNKELPQGRALLEQVPVEV